MKKSGPLRSELAPVTVSQDRGRLKDEVEFKPIQTKSDHHRRGALWYGNPESSVASASAKTSGGNSYESMLVSLPTVAIN